jgi:hypothetical protein
MAKTKQFTITVDNQPGAVAGIAKTLANAKVNILSKKTLDAARIAYAETPAEQYDLANKPGALAQCLEKLAAKGVNLNSIHATAARGGKKAVVVYTVEAAGQAATATA